ncbi:DUF2809 domain-containing protein [Hymenobacter glaciei]|uniref:DUF2809 domain-containing protein n=1 Tax=Hymenobacter glaciei TaxID=877209 RepID=A0ABP7TAK4_9BACT
MLKFSKTYFLMAVGLFVVEIVIALYVHDRLIRPYAGDFLATILLYCMVRSVVSIRLKWAVAAVLFVSYLIEGLQYVDLLGRLGLQHSRLARIVLGSSFSWADMLAYTLGALAILMVERLTRPAGPAPTSQRPRMQLER